MLALYVAKIHASGGDVQSFLWSVTHTLRDSASALLFIGGSAAWIYITWPKARAAVRAGRCTIYVNGQHLSLYGEKVAIADIGSVEVVRRPFDFQLQLHLRRGAVIRRSVTLLSPSPEQILSRLRSAYL